MERAYKHHRTPNTMRPTSLTNSCARCGDLMPFDPHAQNQLCKSCNRMLALGGDFYDTSNTDRQTYSDLGNSSYATVAHYQPTIPSSYQRSMHWNTPQPSMTPQSFQSTPCPISSQTSMGQQGLKRRHDTAFEQQYPSKWMHENAYAPHTPSLRRQNVSLSATGTQEIIAVPDDSNDDADDDSDDDDDDSGEEFVDAPESQGQDTQSAACTGDEDSEEDAEGEVEEDEDTAQSSPKETADDETREESVDQHSEAEDKDLFTSSFGKDAGKPSVAADDSTTNKPAPPNPDAARQTHNHGTLTSHLQSNTPSHPTTATNKDPAQAQPQAPTKSSTEPPPPQVPRDLAHNYRKQHAFHTRSLECLPRLPLASHRYWIGVLKSGVKPRATQSEKNFTWMKGNRLTTVETVRNAYCTAAAEDDVVLLVGFERPDGRDRCEELNYFADNKVIFRAVKEGHSDAMGRGLCEELIREVVAVVGEDGDDGGKGKGKEIIEID